MQARAVARYVRVTPRKAGQVAKLIRGKSVADALVLLKWIKKASAPIVGKVVKSAFSNLKRTQAASKAESVLVTQLVVTGGPIYPGRFLPRAMGRSSKIRKRTCHITVVVNDQIKKGS